VVSLKDATAAKMLELGRYLVFFGYVADQSVSHSEIALQKCPLENKSFVLEALENFLGRYGFVKDEIGMTVAS